MKDGKSESTSEVATVSAKTMQATSDLARDWAWIDRSIWTERMLAALDNGVKGNKWFSLSLAKCVLRCSRALHHDRSPNAGEPTPMRITTNWRAVCGRTARTVRREGWASAHSYPYRTKRSLYMGLLRFS